MNADALTGTPETTPRPAAYESTPGPWKQNGDVIQGPNGYGDVVVCRGEYAPEFANKESYPQWEANARLIAAAPVMLATLERIASEPCDHGPMPFCPREAAQAVLSAAGLAPLSVEP